MAPAAASIGHAANGDPGIAAWNNVRDFNDGEGADLAFSRPLAPRMNTPGLEVQRMLARVLAEVVAATHGQQVPWSHSSLLGEIYLAGKP